MTFNFNLTLATNEIAAMELEITVPAPGIVSAYDYGKNKLKPVATDIPAALHLEFGPNTDGGPWTDGPLTTSAFSLTHIIQTRLLLYEIIADEPELESRNLLNDLWEPIVNKFNSRDAIIRLTAASGALDYRFLMPNPSFVRVPWPYQSELVKAYWALQYDHFFRVVG